MRKHTRATATELVSKRHAHLHAEIATAWAEQITYEEVAAVEVVAEAVRATFYAAVAATEKVLVAA